jgi:hypothetical protein
MKPTTLGLALAIGAAAFGRAPEGGPKVILRGAQCYAAVHEAIPMSKLGATIPADIGFVASWLGKNGLKSVGPPFVRYKLVDMPKRLDVEIGFPTLNPVRASGRIVSGTFPAGSYVRTIHMGPYEGLISVNVATRAWAEHKKIHLARKDTKKGVAWGAWWEAYPTDPTKVRDPKKLEADIFYLVEKRK